MDSSWVLSLWSSVAAENVISLQLIIKAKQYFEIVVKDYPKTSYALDSEFKIDLINDLLASKEMYIGRYYFEKKKWISAINRFQTIINDYETITNGFKKHTKYKTPPIVR